MGIERGITIGIETVERHQRPLAAQTQTQGIECGQGTVAIHGSLATDGKVRACIAIIGTQVQEVTTSRIMLAIERLGIRLQFTAQVCTHDIQSGMKAIRLKGETGSESGIGEVVLFLKFFLRTVIARGEDGGGSTIGIECGIHLATRRKGRSRQGFGETDGGRSPLQIIGRRPRGMGSKRTRRTSQILQHRQLTEAEAVVEDQPQARRHPILAEHQRLEPSLFLQLKPDGVIVVAQTVLALEKRLTGILSP